MAEASPSIDALLANSAKVDPKTFDFSGVLDSYRKGQDFRYQQDLRNAFKDENGNFRADLLDPQGHPDSGKMYERLMTIGGAPAVEAASKLAETGFQQDRYRNAPTVQAALDGNFSAPNFPPSTSRNAPAVVAPPLGQGVARGGPSRPSVPAPTTGADGSWRGSDAKGSLIGFLSANNVPEQDQGAAANILGGQLAAVMGRRVDPNAPLDMTNPQVRKVLGNFVRSNGRGPLVRTAAGTDAPMALPTSPAGLPAVGTPQPQMVAQPAPNAAAPSAVPADLTLGGLIPAGYPDPGAYVQRLEAIAGSGRVLPDQLKVLQGRIEAIHKALEPTPDIKNARAAGMTTREYLDRADNANTNRAVLTNSILPKLDKSQDLATAARDEVLAINRAREQLDAPGGIFSGAGADVRLKVAKVAEFLGVPNADKIANTEAFGSAIGTRVLSLVKGLGAGTGISNADRDFAAAMAGGNIKLDEQSIRKILDIGERAARARIDQHNGLADRTLKSSDALRDYGSVYHVDQPDQYQRANQAMPVPKAGTVMNGFKYLGGNPNDQRSWGRI